MNPDVKEKWIAALRSGEYSQTKGYLHVASPGENTKVGYCCLGVLCDVAIKSGVDVEEQTKPLAVALEDSNIPNVVTYDGFASVLPPRVNEWADLTDGDPRVNFTDGIGIGRRLSELNDDGYTFEDIANLIETYL